MKAGRDEVVVAGVGVVSSAGPTAGDLWNAVEAGRSCTRALGFEREGEPSIYGGRAELGVEDLDERARKRLDRSGLMLLAALRRAWRDAGLDHRPPADPERVGIVTGSSLNALSGMFEEHDAWLRHGTEPRPSELIRCSAGAAASFAAWSLGIAGPILSLSGSSVTTACALGEAWSKIAAGWLDVCLVAGAEAPLHPFICRTFQRAGLLAHGGPEAFRPFDRQRCGTQLGEAGAAIILESREHAERRGAAACVDLLGFGTAHDPSFSWTSPDPDGQGLLRAARRALGSAQLTPPEIDYVQLHGTGTRANDAAEARAMGHLFGIEEVGRLPAAATKPITGHCLGASGVLETVTAIGAITRGFIPPTLNYAEPDANAVAVGVSAELRRKPIASALVNTVGFGGQNAVLVLGRRM
jgi:3-oxoacyl-[acyl-carrier-protein] synthase II